MTKRVIVLVAGAVLLLNYLVSAASAADEGASAPPPPPAPLSDIPDILKLKPVPAPPAKTPGMPKPGVVPPPPGKAPGTVNPGVVPPPPGKTPDMLKPRAVPPPLPGGAPGTVKDSPVPPPPGGVPGMLIPKGVVPPMTPTVSGPAGPSQVVPHNANLINFNSIGGIKLGMTIGEARRLVGNARFERETGSDGIPILLVSAEPDFRVELYFDYDDPDAPVSDDAVINYLIARGTQTETVEGVRVGMSLAEVENIYGKVKEIWRSEIESAEFASFANNPSGLSFGLMADEGSAGVYRTDEPSTTVYASDAKVRTIAAEGLSVMDEENIAGIKIGDLEGAVNKAVATNTLGRVDKGEEWMSDAIGAKIQTWDFPDSGLSVDMMSYEGEPKSVMSIILYSPSTKLTGMGVGIGTAKAEAIRAYENFINGTEQKGFFEGEDAHLVGSIYGGLVIHFDQGKVSNLFLGASAE